MLQNIMTFNKCSIDGKSYGDPLDREGNPLEITEVNSGICFYPYRKRVGGDLLSLQRQLFLIFLHVFPGRSWDRGVCFVCKREGRRRKNVHMMYSDLLQRLEALRSRKYTFLIKEKN